jgi:hypothetical protein
VCCVWKKRKENRGKGRVSKRKGEELKRGDIKNNRDIGE